MNQLNFTVTNKVVNKIDGKQVCTQAALQRCSQEKVFWKYAANQYDFNKLLQDF